MKDIRTGTFRSGTILAAMALAIPALAAASAPAGAAEKLRLTIISGNNFHYAPVGMAIKVLIPKVDEILARTGNYKISWIQGFGGTVVKVRGELDGVEAGLGDLGVVPGPFHPAKLSLYQIGYVTPFTSLDVQVATNGMTHLFKTYPAMGEQPQRFNQSTVAITGTADNYLLWTKTKITKFEDLKGMKIGAVGSNIPWITAAGATPVTIKGLATVYNSLKTGIYEGGVLWQQVMAAFKYCELAPYKLDTSFGAIANALLMANNDSWAKMPREVRAAITEAGPAWSAAVNKAILGGAKWGQGVCEKKYNQQTTTLTAAQKRQWAFAIPNIAKSWAKRQDKAGLPGSKMLSTWMGFMRDNKQLVTRDWDRE
jgi:TRAP-type C4-dicarboxylate transport system substrate-binding protein